MLLGFHNLVDVVRAVEGHDCTGALKIIGVTPLYSGLCARIMSLTGNDVDQEVSPKECEQGHGASDQFSILIAPAPNMCKGDFVRISPGTFPNNKVGAVDDEYYKILDFKTRFFCQNINHHMLLVEYEDLSSCCGNEIIPGQV